MLNSLVKYVAIIEIHYHNVTTQHLTVLYMAYEKNVKVHIVTDIKVNQKSLIYRPQREVQRAI